MFDFRLLILCSHIIIWEKIGIQLFPGERTDIVILSQKGRLLV